MKKALGLLFFMVLGAGFSFGQLADGATAPDFTFTDIDGHVQSLYSYLNAGKRVALEVSATWCHPCWLYHGTGVMDSLYTRHDVPGDQQWKVLFLEGDGNTTLADLQGAGTSTQGNWIAGTLYPIMNPSGMALNDFLSSYNNSFFPTLYIICPDKKIHQDTLNKGEKPAVSTWEYVANMQCGPAGLDEQRDANPLTLFPNPGSSFTTLYFALNSATDVMLVVTNVLGQTVASHNFGTLQAGDQSLHFDLGGLTPGVYVFTIAANGRSIRKKMLVQ